MILNIIIHIIVIITEVRRKIGIWPVEEDKDDLKGL